MNGSSDAAVGAFAVFGTLAIEHDPERACPRR
jgi:hypothetical protein